MKIFLDKSRLKTLTVTVLLVGIVLLVYNLATPAGSDPQQFESKTFSNTLIAHINAFITVFLYWSLFSAVINYIPNLDIILLLLFLILLITLTLIPVANLLYLQNPSLSPVAKIISFLTFISKCSIRYRTATRYWLNRVTYTRLSPRFAA
jgi:uncharacterized membrane protein